MKVLLLLALLGCACALQAPVEYEYEYRARVATAIQSGRPQCAGTGLKAKVTVTVEQDGQATIQISDVKVGEGNSMIDNNGRDEQELNYEPIKDKSIEEPFTAYFRKKDGETVMEVPEGDMLWTTNVRRGIVNFFRIAPIVDPSSVRPPRPGPGNESDIEPQVISRFEDTFAGKCRVGYTLSRASLYDVPEEIHEDIQSRGARKSSGGSHIKLEDNFYSLKKSIDWNSCSHRVALIQTGATNLTNVTSSTFRDVASRTYFGQYILKGSADQLRIESGLVETEFIMNPFGVETDKMIIVSNQTALLQATRPAPRRVSRKRGSMKEVKTWKHQIQSPNGEPQGYSPDWVIYKNENDQGFSPIFYERLVSGFGWDSSEQESLRTKAREAILRAAERLDKQNKESTEAPEGYKGTDDGRAAQELHHAHKILRTLNKEQINKLDSELEQGPSSVAHELFLEILAVAASGPSLDVLFDKINNGKLSDNRTASIFFSLTNNIQSPEPIEKMMKFVMSLSEEERVMVSLLSKSNFALMARRLCVSPHVREQSYWRYAYGDKMCEKSKIISEFLPHLEKKITGSSPIWVKILNTIALGDLGAKESLSTLEKVARGKVNPDKFLRYAAIHGMGRLMFDNTSQDQIFNILQPIAESQVEDYRIRQIAYSTLLSWKPNSTFIQRMAMLSNTEPSVQVQSYIYWTIDSLARVDDPAWKPLSVAARNFLPMTRYMSPSTSRAMFYTNSRYVKEDRIGGQGAIAWLTQLKNNFPHEIYTYLNGKFGEAEVPLFEAVTFSNTESAFTKLRQTVNEFSTSTDSTEDSEPDLYTYVKLFRTSEAFLPMTSEIYKSLQSSLRRRNGSDNPERLILHKYMNPIESNVILPTPVGLFFHIESSSPTIFYSNMEVDYYSEPSLMDAKNLPSLQRVNIKAEGIVKAVFKINTAAHVFAPWTNKTVMASVDNEKSISLPMKFEAEASLKLPAQILWGKITPLFNQTSSRIPVVKVRNMPYTAVGGLLPSPADGESIHDFKQVRWLYSEDQETNIVWPISPKKTGLNAEATFRGEALPPFYQPNIYNYVVDQPSRLLSLLVTPTIKGYDMSLYQKPGNSPTKSIGFYFRYLTQKGDSSAQPITVPRSASEPMESSPSDSLTQREEKLRKFSPRQNFEYSMQWNFTGSEVKKYEVNLAYAIQEGTVEAQNIQQNAQKVQLSFIQKNSEAERKPSTCFVGALERPELEVRATVQDLLAAHEQDNLSSALALNIYEGDSCTKSSKPVADSWANLTVSDTRIVALSNASNKEDLVYNNTHEFLRLAVYDQCHLEVKWEGPSKQLLNNTLRVRDLLEGYLFPKILKNYLAKNEQSRMVVDADRSISDDRANVWVRLPAATIQGQRINIARWFDIISGFTPDVYHHSTPSAVISAAAPGDKCFILPGHVRTFDGASYEKPATTCKSLALKSLDGKLSVFTRITESKEQQVTIAYPEMQLKIVVEGRNVVVNNQPMTEKYKEVMDHSRNPTAKVYRNETGVEVILMNVMRLQIREGHKMMLKLDARFEGQVEGLCGNYNSDPSDDLKDNVGCYYPTSKGPNYGAAWIMAVAECREPSMTGLFDTTRHYQEHCPKNPIKLHESMPHCEVKAYPIARLGAMLCVSNVTETMCEQICKKEDIITKTNPSKCWDKNNAPRSVIIHATAGFIKEPVHEAPQYSKQVSYQVPQKCTRKFATLSDDRECYVQDAYPVRRSGPLLCVTKSSTTQCKSTCNVEDTSPTRMEGNCWNEESAPAELKEAETRGYVTSPVNGQAPFTKDMYVQVPKRCTLHRRH